MAVDESYRSIAFIAACLTSLHFILPTITSYPACADDFTYFAPSAMLVCLGTFYSLAFVYWVYISTPSDFFNYEENSNCSVNARKSRDKPAEDIRYMAFLWMTFGATGILSNDLIWAARYISTNFRSTDYIAYVIWTFWISLSGIGATFVTLALGHLLSMGAEAGIEAAESMLRRVEKAKAKAKMQ